MHACSHYSSKKASKSYLDLRSMGCRYITEEKEMKRHADRQNTKDPPGKEDAVSAQKVGLLKTAKHS